MYQETAKAAGAAEARIGLLLQRVGPVAPPAAVTLLRTVKVLSAYAVAALEGVLEMA
jgi:hypothetical protein